MSKPSSVRNTVGSYFLARTLPIRSGSFTNIPTATTNLKAKIELMNYHVVSLGKNESVNAPIDPFTGQEFVIDDTGDSIRVKSEHFEFEIKK